MKKKIFQNCICRIGWLILLLVSFAGSSLVVSAAEAEAGRHIYIVYDNSGSMNGDNLEDDVPADEKPKAYAQAAYSVELIAALMEQHPLAR